MPLPLDLGKDLNSTCLFNSLVNGYWGLWNTAVVVVVVVVVAAAAVVVVVVVVVVALVTANVTLGPDGIRVSLSPPHSLVVSAGEGWAQAGTRLHVVHRDNGYCKKYSNEP